MTNNNKFSRSPKDSRYHMYGKHAVLAALANKKRRIVNIFCTEEIFKLNQKLIGHYEYEIVDKNFFTKTLGANTVHQGIAATVETIFLNDINDVDISKNNCKIAILDQITDPQNIGSIIRSAASFEIDIIIVPSDNTPNENATIAKAASGSLEFVTIVKVVNIKHTIEYLKKQGFWIIGLDSGSTEFLTKELLTNKIVIVLGSEDAGLRRLTKEACDYLVKIPMSKQIESLNVSNAASIAFYLSMQTK
jgi:23S rRNA (guanosine2251-2'-O)-methyltransferase